MPKSEYSFRILKVILSAATASGLMVALTTGAYGQSTEDKTVKADTSVSTTPKQKSSHGKSSKKPIKKVAPIEQAPVEVPAEEAKAYTPEKFNPEEYKNKAEPSSSAGITMDFTPFVGLATESGIEGGILTAVTFLPSGFPMPLKNSLAVEVGLTRAQWKKEGIATSRFALTTDARWSLHVSEVVSPYVGLGVLYSRIWLTTTDYQTAAVRHVGVHGKLGTAFNFSDSFGIRVELDPPLKVFRFGVAITL